MNIAGMQICLWFDREAEEAVHFYTSIFPDSAIDAITYFGKEGFEHHGMAEGMVATIRFRLNNMPFLALNGGPIFTFNEAISVIIECDTQAEIDDYWNAFTQEGQAGPCGWLKDRYGLSWQITPRLLKDLLLTTDVSAKSRVERALFSMQKLDIQALQDAYHNH